MQVSAEKEHMSEEEVTTEEIQEETSAIDQFLGDSFGIERTGIIRPGIMVPKSGCPDHLVKLYKQLAEKDVSWDEIAKTLGTDNDGKSWLTMRNVDYFTLRPSDCEVPRHAARLKELYGDPDGYLRRIPISFPFDAINMLISVRLSSYTQGGLVAAGTYDGENLICRTPVTAETKVRTFGKPSMASKACVPEECGLYQSKKCKMRGGFIFRIPKIPGLGVWAFYTGSFNTLRGVRNKLKTIKDMLNGWSSLSTMPNVFYLKKIKRRVGTERREQYLITIDTDYAVDEIIELVNKEGHKRDVIGTAVAAVRKLNGRAAASAPAAESVSEEEKNPLPAPTPESDQTGTVHPLDTEWPEIPSKEGTAGTSASSSPKGHPEPDKQPASSIPNKTDGPGSAKQAAGIKQPPSDTKLTGPSRNLESFLKGILKNQEIAGATLEDVIKGVGEYCVKLLKKNLWELDSKDCSRLMNALQAEIKRGQLAEIVFQRVSR